MKANLRKRAPELWRSAEADEEEFWVDAPFVRSVVEDEKDVNGAKSGDLTHSGYLSTWVEDRDGEYVHPDAFNESLGPWLQKNPIMLWQHSMDQPIGNFKTANTDATGLLVNGWQPKPSPNEPDWKWLAYESVRKGIVKTYSMGGYFQRELDRGLLMIKRVDLMEGSVVSIPSNPDSIFEAAAKSLKGGSARPELSREHVRQMEQILGVKELTHPELSVMDETQRRQRYAELAEFYKKCGKRAPAYEEWHELYKDVFSSKGLAAVGSTSRVIAFMQKVGGYAPSAELKTGRAISAKNEEKLRKVVDLGSQAHEIIKEVLDSVDKSETQEVSDG